MYREDSWEEGHYIDNHEKHQCADCGKQFILGKRMVEELFPFDPQCPYCGSKNVELVAWTEDEQLEELSDSMGCLAISVDLGATGSIQG